MLKLLVLYGHPANPEAFEDYYLNTHGPHPAKMYGLTHPKATKFINQPDGSKPAFYRRADFGFGRPELMQKSIDSPVAKEACSDMGNFEKVGVPFITGAFA